MKNKITEDMIESTPGEPPSAVGYQEKQIFQISENTQEFIDKFYPNIDIDDWNDWRWQIKMSVTNKQELKRFFFLEDYERNAFENKLKFRVTPYYLSLIINSPELRKTVIPTTYENIYSQDESEDPLFEDRYKISNIVHKYKNRALFLSTNFCSTVCRYFTRSRCVMSNENHRLIENHQENNSEWKNGIDYIRNHDEINDVIISGGDPLTCSDDRIEWLLRELRDISHIEIIRIGTKIPTVCPQRITDRLTNILKKYHPIFINIHLTHPNELTSEMKEACGRLSDAGCPLFSQTVLLNGVNDSIEIMKLLMSGALRMRVKPYYLYICDKILGSGHFRTSIDKGKHIIKKLRSECSGLAIPSLILDSEKEKILMLP